MNLIGRKKGLQRMAKNKWYECSHWTYKENCGWLIERGIVAFHWSNSQGFHWSILLKNRGQNGMSYGKLRVDPKVFPKKKRVKNPVRKKVRKMISLTLPVTSFLVMKLPVTSFPVTSRSPSNVRPVQHDILLTQV